MKKSKITSLLLGFLSACLTTLPVKAAEEISLSYGPLILSIPVKSLETFAEEGTIDAYLRDYLKETSPEEQAKFREALKKRININPVFLSRFFNSAMGADMLFRLGKGITIQGGINGKYAIRGALVSAALDPDGLTLLNVLKKFPTNIQLEGELLIGLVHEIDILILAQELFTAKMREWTAEEAATVNPPVNYANMPDIRKKGPYEVTQQRWILTDKSRDRQFYVDVYIPQSWREGKTPVVIFSHGLASRPEDFGQAMEHLASYGYVVAAPQHPGSDQLRMQAMLDGYYRDIFDLDEFINRPKDISYVIDELERRNSSEFQGKLDLTNVGVVGHSFGGYTVLAIAGAEIDFDNLEQDCNRLYAGLNMSLILECRALELPRQAYNFRDSRVTAVFAANPVNRSIFGQKGLSLISIPTILGSGSYDPAANPLFEQAASFTWLTTPHKYLAMVEGQAHVNFTHLDAAVTKTLDSVGNLVLPSQDLIGNYANAVNLSFFEVYISKNETYRPYLQSAYAEYLSQSETFKLDFISAPSSEKLETAIKKFQQEHGKIQHLTN